MTTEPKSNAAADGRPGAGSEASAQSSETFDSLIQEFEQKTGTPNDRSGEVLKALKPVIEHVEGERIEKQQAAVQEELDTALDFVSKGDGLDKLPKNVLRGFMEAFAIEDKAFASAFQNRASNPGEWQAQLEKGRNWASEQFKQLSSDGKSREDLEAAKAAVAGTENEAVSSADSDLPSAAKMFGMSGSAWQEFMAEQRAKAAMN